MKVLNLQCRHGHGFEGWFSSEDDYHSQQERGLLTCPFCEDTEISRLPSAPRLNLSGAREPQAAPAAAPPSAPAPGASMQVQELQAVWLKAVREVLKNTEDVGDRFAEEARRIHYGEAEARAIRGSATREDTQALVEEGIEVLPLPIPAAAKDRLQ
ncbi:DUF1178 family protein [Aquabacterium sp. A7-Y]|uniref:DUF1178 family protein n=1 Tax=Aquabacterium sp. A7-Y TaxID=1349605 RepID=UPI00223E5104|nr:DUF1178 family protein [Aquabacterium sp. A7-Y]MCW7538136.1 DUF1178 family protein [Aquabacterium sp. A7-Y]